MRFKGKVVLIIGGNSGIGRATAKAYIDHGAYVIITGRNRETITEVERELGDGLVGFVADVADPESLDPVLEHLVQRHGHLDILFVNAGIGWFAPISEITPEVWDTVHNVNARGCFFAAQKALTVLVDGGRIVFNASIASVMGMVGNTTYSASKAALRAVARGMAIELLDRRIRVNVVSPGPVDTEIFVRSGLNEAEAADVKGVLSEHVPMKRLGRSEEVANAVLFLTSDEASYINGIELYVDGGCVEL